MRRPDQTLYLPETLALSVTTRWEQVQSVPAVELLRRSLHMRFADILSALA